ncbi:putative Zn(II)2Cys6 transcription factor [Phyllosticta citrichinensis]|uniref:Zn(II)2Cys6 transcription factor n=1 Tax=Phyllosticta citrichinensis TaxID=1130410 RepID=A0ABR1XPY4_9PEZI
MKRNAQGQPVIAGQRWTQPSVSCQLCRTKKLRCDRSQPCSNCSTRGAQCVYAGQGPAPSSSSTIPSSAMLPVEEILQRLQKLEQAVFKKGDPQTNAPGLLSSPEKNASGLLSLSMALVRHGTISVTQEETPNAEPTGNDDTSRWLEGIATTPNSVLSLTTHATAERNDSPLNLLSSLAGRNQKPTSGRLCDQLPARKHALELLDHFAMVVDCKYRLLHVPSTRTLVEETYQGLIEGTEPPRTTLLLLFSIFASSAYFWTKNLSDKLQVSLATARNAFNVFSKIAVSLVDQDGQTVKPSMMALQAISILTHLFNNSDGFSTTFHLLRSMGCLMAQSLRIHHLDTPQSQHERKVNGSNMVEVEVKRRIWWHIVSSDWLLSFLGGPQEGTYAINPKQMRVSYPVNADDELITTTEAHSNLPLTVPTSMSSFIQRIKLAELCREVVDSLPSTLLEPRELNYDMVLDLNAKFQDYLKALPFFFQLDPANIERSRNICRERPYIAWQRTMVHFSAQTRICRLHRPFLLEGSSNPKYAFSRMTCIRAAHAVLELRRSMDDLEPRELDGTRFVHVMHHVFMAAVILATNACFDPNEPNVEARKAEVMAACKVLERDTQESTIASRGLQKGIDTLRGMLQKHKSQPDAYQTGQNAESIGGGSNMPYPSFGKDCEGLGDPGDSRAGKGADDVPHTWSEGPQDGIVDPGEHWDQLWSDFFDVAPGLDTPNWNSLLNDMDFSLGPG